MTLPGEPSCATEATATPPGAGRAFEGAPREPSGEVCSAGYLPRPPDATRRSAAVVVVPVQ